MSTSPSKLTNSKPQWTRRISVEVRYAVRSVKYQHHKLTRSASKTRAKGKAKAVFDHEYSSNNAPGTAPVAPLKRKRSCSCDRKRLSNTFSGLPQHKSRRFPRRIRSDRAHTKRKPHDAQMIAPVELATSRCRHFPSTVSFQVFVPEVVEAHAGPVTMASWKRAERERCRVREDERVEQEMVEELRRAGDGLGTERSRRVQSSDCFTLSPIPRPEAVPLAVLTTIANKESAGGSEDALNSEPAVPFTATGYSIDPEINRQRIVAYLNREAVDAWLGLHDADAADLQVSDPTSSGQYGSAGSDENGEYCDGNGAEYHEYASVICISDDIEVEPAAKLRRRLSLIKAVKRLRSSLKKRQGK